MAFMCSGGFPSMQNNNSSDNPVKYKKILIGFMKNMRKMKNK